MKKFSALLMALLLAVTLCFSACAEEAQPLLWRVTDGDDHEIYLFGSIHVAASDLYPLNDKVMDAFAASDALACEMDLLAANNDMTFQLMMANAMLCESGKSTADYLTEETYQGMVAFAEQRGFYNQGYLAYQPSLWLQLIQSVVYMDAGLDAENGVDLHFLALAKERGMEILEVEGAYKQLELLTGFSDEVNEMQVRELVNDYDTQVQSMQEMFAAWAAGDADALYAATLEMPEDITDEERVIYQDYVHLLFGDRNTLMADTAEQYLKNGQKVFFMVGVGHMLGDDGIVAQLTQKGYTVQEIGR